MYIFLNHSSFFFEKKVDVKKKIMNKVYVDEI